MPAITLDQIPAYLKQRVGFWAKVTGKSADELLRGFQFEILLLESMLDKLGGVSQPLQPLPQPSQVNPVTYTATSPYQIDNLTIGTQIVAGGSFATLTAPFDGVAILSVALSAGGVLSMIAKVAGSNSSPPAQLLGGTKLPANVWVDIPIQITSGNSYTIQSDTAGTASWQIVGYQEPTVLSPFTSVTSGGATGVVTTDTLITTTSLTTILTYTTGSSNEALEAALNLNVITAATIITATLSWTDPNNGPQTFNWENGGSVPVGSHSYEVYPFTASANTNVYVQITAGTASQVYASSSIEKQV